MKIPEFLLIPGLPALALLLHAMGSASNQLPPEANALITETVDAAIPHLESAIRISSAEDEGEENFAALAKGLKAFGFGNSPVLPPWLRNYDAEKDELAKKNPRAAEDRRKESIERVERLGQYDIEYLKKIDLNGDLKTDGDEMRKALTAILVDDLKDKLGVDSDGDGRLSLQEYALVVPAKGEVDEDGVDWHQRGHFEQDDANEDGYLDAGEMMGHTARALIGRSLLIHLMFLLPGVDSDGDGELSETEFSRLSENAAALWSEVSENGDSIRLAEGYPGLYWLSNEKVSSLLPK